MRLLKAITNLKRAPEIARCAAATPHWVKLTAAYLGLPVKLPFEIRLKTGSFGFTTLADVQTFWSIFFAGTYKVKFTDETIVDVGANIGTFTLYALLKAPNCNVIAIEPAPDACDRLRKVVREHGFAARCLIHQAALGNREGTTSIDLKPESQFRSTGIGSTSVPMVTLEKLVQGAEIDMLKFDAEGVEYQVVSTESSSCLRQVHRMTLEYHPNGSLADLIPPLEYSGLKCISRRDDGAGYGIASFAR